MKDFWILTRIDGPNLSRHNSWYYRLHWYNYRRHEMHVTDTDIKHRNFKTKRWNQIIERGTVYGVFDNMRLHPTRTTRDQDPLVNADSQPRWICDLEESQVETLIEHRQQQREQERAHPMDRLFVQEDRDEQ